MDYGLFAIVFIHYILAEKKFFHSSMRNHASNCLNNDDLEMFPESENSPKKKIQRKGDPARYILPLSTGLGGV